MIIYPAIDLRGGRAVQLVGGNPSAERVSIPDPVAIARQWVALGFRALHLVDLDAALGTGSNLATLLEILDAVQVPVQVGGGIRDDDVARAILDAGAARVITGTRALEDPEWLATLADRWPGRICVALDTRDGRLLTCGWTTTTGDEVGARLEHLAPLPLAAILVTDVNREGRLAGADATLFHSLAARTRHPILAAGGITNMDDLRALQGTGVAGAIIGMSLYTGALDPRTLVQEFG